MLIVVPPSESKRLPPGHGLPVNLDALSFPEPARRHEGWRRRGIGVVVAKQLRGQAARHLLESGEEPEEPGELARILADRWPTQLREPERPGKPWTITLTPDD